MLILCDLGVLLDLFLMKWFFVNLLFLDINGKFLSLLPDVMQPVHDGPQWK